MRRLYSAAALIIMLHVGAGQAAEEAAARTTLDYWPSQPGTTWIYQDERGVQTRTRVAGETTLDGQTAIVVERGPADGARVFRTYYAIQDGAVLLVAMEAPPGTPSAGLQRLSPARLQYPAHLVPGQSWDFIPGRSELGMSSVRGEETVTVPAGTYHALVVTTSTKRVVITEWLAPAVGLVRREATTPAGATRSLELVRISLGGG